MFDTLAPTDEVIHIARIELALRVSDVAAVGPALASALRAEIERRTTNATPPSTAPFDRGSQLGSTQAAEHTADALIRYLESGLVPWPLANVGRDVTLGRLRDLAAVHFDRVLSRVPDTLTAAVAFVFRWLQLLSIDDWPALADRIDRALGESSSLSPCAPAIGDLVTTSGATLTEHQRHRVVAAIIAIRLRRQGDREAVRALVSAMADRAPLPRAPIDATAPANRLPALANAWIVRNLPMRTVDDRSSSPSQIDPSTATARQPDERDPLEPAPSFGLATDYAGLVLLHAFLPALFERTGITDAGSRAITDDALPRAAALLSFAAIGDDAPFEFELSLIKILLGRRPDTPLHVSAGLLRPQDRDEIESLLSSVVEHWRALKRTSIAALRSSFLQRRGLLAETDGVWQLRVESQPFDVLLDQLPWSISIVRLPWMTTPLFTEWTTR